MSISFAGAKRLKKHNGFSVNSKLKSPLPSPFHFFGLKQAENITLKPLVNKGDYIRAGQKIADVDNSDAVPIYSSISGTVSEISDDMISVENNFLFECAEAGKFAKNPENMTERELLWTLREGSVFETRTGLPLHVVLSKRSAKCAVVCCFDSDPYISSPQMAAKGNAKEIIEALKIILNASGIEKAFIGVENSPKAIYLDFKYQLRYNENIRLYSLKARYPQSRDDILIKTLTGKDSNEANAVVLSSETLLNTAKLFKTNRPVTDKIVTVSGDDILLPQNYFVPLGMPISSLLSNSGYTSPKAVIVGGVIDGNVITDLDIPVDSHTNAVLAFNVSSNALKYEQYQRLI